MSRAAWLKPELVFTAVDAASPRDLVAHLAAPLARAADVPPLAVGAALAAALRADGAAVGRGVAFPHAELPGLAAPLVAVVTLQHPIPLPSLDGVDPDILFIVLAPPGRPDEHLQLLAHLARLAHSRTLIAALRGALAPADAVTLLRAAEGRHLPPSTEASATSLVTVTIAGEQALDALLVALVDLGLDDATLLEGQSLREAAAREVPLFSSFRDLFGDPSGRRVLLAAVPTASVADVHAAVAAVCASHTVPYARVTTVPVATTWHHRAGPPAPRGH